MEANHGNVKAKKQSSKTTTTIHRDMKEGNVKITTKAGQNHFVKIVANLQVYSFETITNKIAKSYFLYRLYINRLS